MLRALFQKTGSAVYISHLDLMRLFQRAFQRGQLPLTHTQGFNPRPSVSIAMPLSLGMESNCELLDFQLEREVELDSIQKILNANLIGGIQVLQVYETGRRLKELSYLRCTVTLEYDGGIPADATEGIRELFARESLILEKKNRNGVTQQDIIPMLRKLDIEQQTDTELVLRAIVCCQNPTLNPMQLATAIDTYAPEWKPDFVRCRREEIYDGEMKIFR